MQRTQQSSRGADVVATKSSVRLLGRRRRSSLRWLLCSAWLAASAACAAGGQDCEDCTLDDDAAMSGASSSQVRAKRLDSAAGSRNREAATSGSEPDAGGDTEDSDPKAAGADPESRSAKADTQPRAAATDPSQPDPAQPPPEDAAAPSGEEPGAMPDNQTQPENPSDAMSGDAMPGDAMSTDGMSMGEPPEGEPPAGDAPTEPGAVRWLGRVDDSDPDAVRFSWAGAGLIASVSGSTLSARIESENDDVYYQSVIDGEPVERFVVPVGEHVVTLGTALEPGVHTVELYRDTEGDGPVSIFRGFEEGFVVGAPEASGRFFEIVGDSITVGFGSLGTERHGDNPGPECGAEHANSSWFHTYGAIAARALDAEVSAIARSGYGMVRGYGQNMSVMPPLFDHTMGDQDEPTWSFERQPQAVVINLGTNDWNGGDPGTPYETAYVAFVTEVRERYPEAWILLTIGPSLDPGRKEQVVARLERVVSAREWSGERKIDIIDIGIQDTAVTGCSWHPSAAEHERMGAILTEELRTRLGWQ